MSAYHNWKIGQLLILISLLGYLHPLPAQNAYRYNLKTRSYEQLNIPTDSPGYAGFNAPAQLAASGTTEKIFNASTEAHEPETSTPARMSVLIQARFANGRVQQSTGTMIGPWLVATALENVYRHIYSEPAAISIEVFPAHSRGHSPYGSSSCTDALIWANTSYALLPEFQMAILRLDKPLGAYSGYAGILGGNLQARGLMDRKYYTYGYRAGATLDLSVPLLKTAGQFDNHDDDFVYIEQGGQTNLLGSGYLLENYSGHYGLVGIQTSTEATSSYTAKILMTDEQLQDAATFFYNDQWEYLPDVVPLSIELEMPYPQVDRFYHEARISVTALNNSREDIGPTQWRIFLSEDKTLSADDHLLAYTTLPTIIDRVNRIESSPPINTLVSTAGLEPGCYYVIPQVIDPILYHDNTPIEIGITERICFDPAPICEEVITFEQQGTLTDGSGPYQHYWQRTNCSFGIVDTVFEERTIAVDFTHFNLGDYPGTKITIWESYDLVELDSITSFSAQFPPFESITTNAPLLVLSFRSDAADHEGGGWELNYTVTPGSNLGGAPVEKTAQVLPNPAQDHVRLDVDIAPTATQAYRIVSAFGQPLATGEVSRYEPIDISGLAPGIYFLVLLHADHSPREMVRFVKI